MPEELAQYGRDVTILDVRTPGEYESEHIPGSFNVPLDQLPLYAVSLRDTVHKPVVLVCRSGARAKVAESTLKAKDLQGLHVLAGGVSAWEADGRPLVRGVQQWDIFRQVRGVAGTLVLVFALLGILVWQPLTWGAAAVGFGLLFSALSNNCMMANMLGKLPYNRGGGCDVSMVLAAIAATQDGVTGTAAD
ncbi:MAG: rhodanese-like domain-containing protein [Thermomicrobiales bacterium]